MTDEVHKEEIHRRLENLEEADRVHLHAIESIKEDVANQNTEVALVKQSTQTIEKRLTEINGNIKWLVKIVLGAVILGVISFWAQGGVI